MHAPDAINIEFLLQEAEREYRSFIVEHNDIVTNTHVDYCSAAVSLTPKSAPARYEIALMRASVRGNGMDFDFLAYPQVRGNDSGGRPNGLLIS